MPSNGLLENQTEILFFAMQLKTADHYIKTTPLWDNRFYRMPVILNTNLEMASGEYRRERHKYLTSAALNFNTTNL